jgi:hypothetical protein
LEEHTAYDGFQVPPAFHPAGNVHPGRGGEGNQVKGVAGPEKFPEKGPGHIVVHFPVSGAHAGRGVQQQNQIHGLLSGSREKRTEDEENRQKKPFHSLSAPL